MSQAEKPLTRKQELFVREYLFNQNAADAARKAGYKGDAGSLATTGHRLLNDPRVFGLVEQKRQEFVNDLDLDVQWVLHKFKSAVDQYLETGEYAQHGLRALEDIGKFLGMFVERKEIRGTLDITHTEVVKDYGEEGKIILDAEHKVLEDASPNGNSSPN
jgi:hypothetical protein